MNFSKHTLVRIENPVECFIVRRVNRFVVEVSVGGSRVKAYVNNTGRLRDYLTEGRRAYCLPNPGVGKTRCRVFAVEDAGSAALIDVRLQTRVFEEALARGLIPWLRGFKIVKRNIRLLSSLVDYLLERNGVKLYLEVKSAVKRVRRIYAAYPDCPTVRGRRHIRDLIEAASRGLSCMLVFIAGLPCVEGFKPDSRGDPEVFRLLEKAYSSGVAVKAVNVYYDPGYFYLVLGNPDLRVEIC